MTPRTRWTDAPWLRPALLIAVILATTTAPCRGADVPAWVLRGMMAVETSSRFDATGAPVYVNQRRGLAGEVGITQAMPRTLRTYGFSPSLFEQDPQYALAATSVILTKYRDSTGSWWQAVAKWRQFTAYRSPPAQDYALRVSRAGGE